MCQQAQPEYSGGQHQDQDRRRARHEGLRPEPGRSARRRRERGRCRSVRPAGAAGPGSRGRPLARACGPGGGGPDRQRGGADGWAGIELHDLVSGSSDAPAQRLPGHHGDMGRAGPVPRPGAQARPDQGRQGGRHEFSGLTGRQDRLPGSGGPGLHPGQAGDQQHAEGVDVRRRGERGPGGQFRRPVRIRARRLVPQGRQAEVRHLHSVLAEDDVARSHIAVHHAGPVRGGQHLRDRRHHARASSAGSGPPSKRWSSVGPGTRSRTTYG